MSGHPWDEPTRPVRGGRVTVAAHARGGLRVQVKKPGAGRPVALWWYVFCLSHYLPHR